MELLFNIDIKFNPEQIASDICFDSTRPEFEEFKELIQAVEPVIASKAIISQLDVIGQSEHALISSAGKFSSILLAELAVNAEVVFPFIVTCGKEIEDFSAEVSDPLHFYWLEKLKDHALEQAFENIKSEIRTKCNGQTITSLVPLDDEIWPLTGLKEIFAVFKPEDIKRMGVELTETLYMTPTKTRAGIFFPAEKEVDLCHICNLKKCKHCPVAWNK
jgi:hypothetical protein